MKIFGISKSSKNDFYESVLSRVFTHPKLCILLLYQDTELSIRENAAQNKFVKVVFGSFENSQNFHKKSKNDIFLHKNAICTQPPENAF